MSQDSNETVEAKIYLSHVELLMIRSDLHMDDIKGALSKINHAIKLIEEKLTSKEISRVG